MSLNLSPLVMLNMSRQVPFELLLVDMASLTIAFRQKSQNPTRDVYVQDSHS